MPPGSGNSEDQFAYEPEFIEGAWPIPVRILAGITGTWLISRAMKNREPADILASGLGLTLLSRAATDRDVTQLIGSVLLPVLRLRRSVFISAPVDDVYRFWSRFENYPRFMSFIERVEVNETGGLRWTARGPAGARIRWDTRMGALQPNQKVSWKSVPGSIIAAEGIVQMSGNEHGTSLRVELSYAPPAGALGYAVARILGFDPRTRIDQDLARMRHLIEREVERRSA